MTDEHSHVAPSLEPRQRLAANQVPHDIGIRAQPEMILEITEAIHAQDKALCFKSDFFHFPGSAAIINGRNYPAP
jgi:hypothetical protein